MNIIIWQVMTGLLAIALGISLYKIIRLKKQKQLNKFKETEEDLIDYALSNPNPILGINKFGQSIFANFGSEGILSEWGIGLNDKIPSEWREVVRQVSLSHETHTFEMPCGDKTYFMSVVPRKNDEATFFGMDITPLKDLEKTLSEHSLYDNETKLPNRISFKQTLLEQTITAKASQLKMGILVVRMDDYTQIENTYGQETAESILKEFAKRLTTFSNKMSSIARLGENEFGILEPEMSDAATMASYVQSLIENCTMPYEVAAHDIFINVSIGIAFCPNDGNSPDVLTRNAQLAVNRTNSSRKPFEFFERGMEEQLELKKTILSDLHKAIERNQLELHYQPQVHLGSKKLIGGEALIRWKHPKMGYISPYVFMTTAEESKLVDIIGEWTIRQACQQIKEWRSQGFSPIKIAVNVSAKQVLNTNIVEIVRNIMNETQTTNEWLSLELTESALVQDKDKAVEVMHGFKSLGLELALDDFGTGYSSLSYLAQFPIDKIKIDRSFVVIIEDESTDYTVTKGIIDLGHSMKLKIIAEGVETKAQLKFMQRHDCDMIQGYIFSKPLSSEEFVKLFKVDWAQEISKYD
ncbi:EAL domain-containing protein [Candidatus Berkiella aquae]|uniref:cyclic-guanylate-specific phosphodiesterase n=2 Tax=Candidatus Berkiella aquae TaxID=295108 RepID=A0AAE3HXH2_9GAMM|nr:bifunctional diguanylate cyclase/phosphodiesterase [Candidatus Berkiella aquae]MCS5712406.1 bifunctional diguanylate cyclase/phosphodiesterase [Candidatus Berkiella aquae]